MLWGKRRASETNKQTNKQTKNTLFYSSSIDSFAASQLQFTSRYRGKTVSVLPGSSVNFTWSFSSGSDNGVFLVMWGVKRDGVNFFISNGLLVDLLPLRRPVSLPNAHNKEFSGRVGGSLTGNASSGQAIFTLSFIRNSDERFYSCILFPHRGYKKDYDNLYLLVAEPPNITIPTVLNVSCNEGSPVNITCEAKGNPDPLVKWIHNGQVKSFGFKTAYLAFSQINKADSGIYICKANNSVGRTERQLYLKVNGKFKYVLFSRLSAAYYL